MKSVNSSTVFMRHITVYKYISIKMIERNVWYYAQAMKQKKTIRIIRITTSITSSNQIIGKFFWCWGYRWRHVVMTSSVSAGSRHREQNRKTRFIKNTRHDLICGATGTETYGDTRRRERVSTSPINCYLLTTVYLEPLNSFG